MLRLDATAAGGAIRLIMRARLGEEGCTKMTCEDGRCQVVLRRGRLVVDLCSEQWSGCNNAGEATGCRGNGIILVEMRRVNVTILQVAGGGVRDAPYRAWKGSHEPA